MLPPKRAKFQYVCLTHIECHCPRCRVTRLRTMNCLPLISMGLTMAQLELRAPWDFRPAQSLVWEDGDSGSGAEFDMLLELGGEPKTGLDRDWPQLNRRDSARSGAVTRQDCDA